MSMKTSTTPRRIYTRNAVTHVLFEGRTFGAPADSELSLDYTVTCESMPSDGGRARVQVTQKRKGQKTLVEAWRTVTVPRKPRA